MSAPKTAPGDGYVLYEERTVGVFTVQKWMSASSPEVSPAGMCECLTVVYQGDRRLATLGEAGLLALIVDQVPLPGTRIRRGQVLVLKVAGQVIP